MKTFIKILILAVVAATLSAGVLLFMRTRVTPPQESRAAGNAFVAHADTCIAAFDNLQWAECPKYFDLLSERIGICAKDTLVSESEAMEMQRSLASKYAERLHYYAFEEFGKRSWPNVKAYSQEAKKLLAYKCTDGSKALTAGSKADDVKKVTDNYYAAWSVASSQFKSLSDSRTKIQSANSYKSKPYISNVQALTSALNALPAKLNNQHYAYLKAHELDGGYFSQIKQYHDEGASVYGSAFDYAKAEALYNCTLW